MPDKRSATIETDISQPCTRCGAMGATPRGICLACITEEV